jgi:hypothetical protein
MRQPTIRSRVGWMLVSFLAAAWWCWVVAYGPTVSTHAVWDPPVALAVGILTAFMCGQLATAGTRPGRDGSGTGIV